MALRTILTALLLFVVATLAVCDTNSAKYSVSHGILSVQMRYGDHSELKTMEAVLATVPDIRGLDLSINGIHDWFRSTELIRQRPPGNVEYPPLVALQVHGINYDAFDALYNGDGSWAAYNNGWLKDFNLAQVRTLNIDVISGWEMAQLAISGDLIALDNMTLGGKETSIDGKALLKFLARLAHKLTKLHLTNVDKSVSFESIIDVVAKHHPTLTTLHFHQTGQFADQHLGVGDIQYVHSKLPNLTDIDLNLPAHIPWSLDNFRGRLFTRAEVNPDLPRSQPTFEAELHGVIEALGHFAKLEHLTVRFQNSHLDHSLIEAHRFIDAFPWLLQAIRDAQIATHAIAAPIVKTLIIVMGDWDTRHQDHPCPDLCLFKNLALAKTTCLHDGEEVVCALRSGLKDDREFYTKSTWATDVNSVPWAKLYPGSQKAAKYHELREYSQDPKDGKSPPKPICEYGKNWGM